MIQPDITVAAIIERDGRFLMVEERVESRVVLNQPAGHVEPGENFTQAVVRETREETGLDLAPGALVGIYLWCAPDTGAQILRLCYCGEIDGTGDPTPEDAAIIAAHWIDHDTLAARAEHLRSPLVLRGISDYRAGQRYPLALAQTLAADGELLCPSA